MKYQIEYEKSVANRGNWFRLKQVMKRAKQGEKITLGFLGGSITQGSLSSAPETCFACLVYEWWKKTFPRAEVVYVNAGIGGTTSQFGAARAKEDLLAESPDFVLVDFSVNDEDTEHFCETYEGLVRMIYGSETAPAVLLLYNAFYDTGKNAQSQHGKIARHYKIPAVSIQSSIFPQVEQGFIEKEKITPDGLHPNDAGHELVASVVIYFLEEVYRHLHIGKDKKEEMPKPLTANRYEHSNRMQNGNCEPVCQGFYPDRTPQEHMTQCFKKGWTAQEKGARIMFSVKGSCIGVQYRKSVQQPVPAARVIVDGDTEHAVVLDGNFEETWGDCLYLETVAEYEKPAVHRVEVEITEAPKEPAAPFYLVSVTGSF